jgi:hypothetical protein
MVILSLSIISALSRHMEKHGGGIDDHKDAIE